MLHNVCPNAKKTPGKTKWRNRPLSSWAQNIGVEKEMIDTRFETQ